MNKFSAVALLFVLLLPIGCFSADLDIGTHASFFLPPEGGGNTLMAGIDATYRLNDTFSARGSVDNASYSTSDHKYEVTSASADLIWHVLGKSFFDPYLGSGVVYYVKSTDGIASSTTGLNALAGLSLVFQTFSAGVEVKYTVPDANDMKTGYYSSGGQLTGGLHVNL